MTSHKVKGRITFSCDKCTEIYEPEEQDNFYDAWAEAQSAGWIAFKENGDWGHYCPECK